VGRTYELEEPFFVLATQNPIEQEGTYPLPEAQLDRFMFMIEVDYPELHEEIEIARTTTGGKLPELQHIINGDQVKTFQELVRRMPVPDHIYEFAVHLVRRTRPGDPEAPEWTKELISWGAGPRAVQYLILGAKSRAAILGSYMVRLEDVIAVAEPVLTHRVLTSFGAETEGITSRQIVRRLVDELEKEG
jgi:MoxR-like ATPase